MALCPVGADARDDGQNDILGADARGRLAADGDAHALRPFLPQRLRHQHVRDFRGADAEGVGAERAVGRGMAVAAHDQQSGQRQPLFGADHMDDALARIAETEQLDVVGGGVRLEVVNEPRDLGVGDGAAAVAGRHVVIGDGEGEARLGNRAPARSHLAEGVKRAFVHVVTVDPEERGAVLPPGDLMRRPELVDESKRLVHAR